MEIKEATATELFVFYSHHLDNPCSVVVEEKRCNIRYVYEKAASEVLPRMRAANPELASLLEKKINEKDRWGALP